MPAAAVAAAAAAAAAQIARTNSPATRLQCLTPTNNATQTVTVYTFPITGKREYDEILPSNIYWPMPSWWSEFKDKGPPESRSAAKDFMPAITDVRDDSRHVGSRWLFAPRR